MKFQNLVLSILYASISSSSGVGASEQMKTVKYWNSLSQNDKDRITAQINSFDETTLTTLKDTAIHPDHAQIETLTPFHEYTRSGSRSDFIVGKKLIAEGKVGCLIVAGGQGTRLGCSGPKGVVPVTQIKQKSLFQFLAERVLAAGTQVNRPLLIAIMTSPANHEETLQFFEKNQFFGLKKSQVFFFTQEEIPLLDQDGNLFLESPSRIAMGPDGNAAALGLFVKSGIWDTWQRQGIEYVNYIHIDNPLVDPFDSELTGFHSRNDSSVIIKCIERLDPLEKIGIIINKNGRVGVIEYSEITPEERDARDANGVLKHLCGNISAFSFDMDFIHDVGTKYYAKLPYHKAWKAVKFLNANGDIETPSKPMAWKFERFIFDVLAYSDSAKSLLYPREECFSPLKNATGSDTVADVQKALQRHDRTAFAKITGITPDESQIFELSPQFYYPTPEILTKWKGKSLPKNISYIEP